MASGKLSPRQKMINMMYLVLTAMLALNVSRDILQALTRLNSSLEQTVSTVEGKNQEIYSDFAKAAAENPKKAGKWKDMAEEVKAKSNNLASYIETMKGELVKVSGGTEEESDVPKKLDSREPPANYLLNEKNAEKLKQRIESYRAEMLNYAGDDAQLKSSIQRMFDTSPQKEGDKKIPWENASFEHYPLGAILPFLTDLQAKVRNTESDIISKLRRNIGATDLKFSTVRAVVVPKSNYVTQGDEYEAEVFLAAYDDTQEPTVIINGEQLPAEKIQNGRGKISFKATSVGEQTWGGVIQIDQLGKDEPVKFDIPEQTFTVAPQSVVISPTKMNVLYRGVDNPLEIGVPGVDPSKIRVSGPGVSGSNGQYTANVKDIRGKEITISVAVEETDAEGNVTTRPAGSKEFRIKGLPPAVGSVYTKTSGQLSKGAIARAPVDAEFQDFAFDLPLTVTQFEVAIPGFPPETVRGSKMPNSLGSRIERLKPGETVSIRDIKARGPGGLRVERVSNISIDVN